MAAGIRVSYFLPLTNANDQTAYYRTLDYLRSPRRGVGGHPPVSGFTVSSNDPPTFDCSRGQVLQSYIWPQQVDRSVRQN